MGGKAGGALRGRKSKDVSRKGKNAHPGAVGWAFICRKGSGDRFTRGMGVNALAN